MVTRNTYVAVSRKLQPHQSSLARLLAAVAFGGFILLAFGSQLSSRPEIVVGYGGRIWFSITCMLGVLFLATHWFNPVRDPVDGSLVESSATIFLNVALAMAIAPWFME